MAAIGRNVIAPLMVLNLIMYIVVIGFASWCLNHFINGQTNHPGMYSNGATFYFLMFAILAGVVGAVSKLAGIHHIRAWRNDSLSSNASASLIAWAITALAFGIACKEIHLTSGRGWRLRVLEAFIIILTFTQLIYVLLLHAGLFSNQFGPAYRDPDYGGGAGEPKGTARV
ncbi:hypothetical protein LUZ60_002344 [Juncus effusus]|nr:hypothetical protein LUZ60_002344 [Juncus effusus]